MIDPQSRTVQPGDSRPNGKPGECFFCNEPTGSEHELDCVCRTRTVVVDFTVRAVMEVPESWTPHDIEFKYNDSSWCGNNFLNELEDYYDDAEETCMCGRTTAAFVAEATRADEESYGVFGRDRVAAEREDDDDEC